MLPIIPVIILTLILALLSTSEGGPLYPQQGSKNYKAIDSYGPCTEDSDCVPGQFCKCKSRQRFCAPCISCQEAYNRQNSTQIVQCVKSLQECGMCLKVKYMVRF